VNGPEKYERTGLFAFRSSDDAETTRWPVIDELGPVLGPDERVVWRGRGVIDCYAAAAPAPMARTRRVADFNGGNPEVVFTEQRVLYWSDRRRGRVMFEGEQDKAFRKHNVLVGQIRYSWATALRWESRREWLHLVGRREWVGFDLSQGERELRLMIGPDRNFDAEAVMQGILDSLSANARPTTEARRGAALRIFALRPTSALPPA
jgi:hypothetical protein